MRIEERLIKWLGITVLIIIVLITVVLLIFLSKKISNLTPGGWDFLAFSGAIIGGTITWLGVKLTLKQSVTDKFFNSYDKKMKVLYFSIEQLNFIVNVYNFMVFTEKEINKDLVQYKIETMESFYVIYKEEFSKLLGVIDWEAIHVLDLLSKKFGGITHAKRTFEKNEREIHHVNKFIDECYNVATEIFGKLESHKDLLIKNYYKTKNDA